MQRKTQFIYMLKGLSDDEQSKEVQLDDGSFNFYHDNGYLCNYPGREDLFNRDWETTPPPETDTTLVPPSTDGVFTRIFSFVDFTQSEHIVVCRDSDICAYEGNGVRVLYTLKGRYRGGASYPTLFVHESKLIIIDEGSFPLIWDGLDGVNPLGVQEVPSPPFNYLVHNPFVGGVTNPYREGSVTVHYEKGEFESGPTRRTESDGSTPTHWLGKTVVQFMDKYNNHGRASALSILQQVQPEPDVDAFIVYHMMTEWEPPQSDWHIHSVRQGRTLTYNELDIAPLGNDSNLYTETTEGVTKHRKFQAYGDETLATLQAVDLFVHGPPISRIGCSFGGRIWLADINGTGWYSDLVYFGQFRATQQVRFYSNPVAFLPAGDRLFVIGEQSTEVFYESASGPALFEQDIENGSLHGSSFVVVGDGVIFGLWKKGFGFYDGKEHKYIDAPSFIDEIHIDAGRDDVKLGKLIGKRYMLPVRYKHETSENNHILIFDMKVMQWYIIKESVNDLHEIDNEIYGVDDSIYALFTPGDYPASALFTNGFTPNGISQTAIDGVRILMEPSSAATCSISVYGEYSEESATGTAPLLPTLSISQTSILYRDFWNKIAKTYPANWLAPGDFLAQCSISSSVPGMYHSIDCSFDAGHPVKIKGFEITYESESRSEG